MKWHNKRLIKLKVVCNWNKWVTHVPRLYSVGTTHWYLWRTLWFVLRCPVCVGYVTQVDCWVWNNLVWGCQGITEVQCLVISTYRVARCVTIQRSDAQSAVRDPISGTRNKNIQNSMNIYFIRIHTKVLLNIYFSVTPSRHNWLHKMATSSHFV